MREKLNLNKDFYRELAHLFYAIASADRIVVLEEKRRIVREVECYWNFKTNTFDGKTILFDTMRQVIAEELETKLAFKAFSKFYTDNKKDFSPEVKRQIMDSVNAIARSFSGANKSELTVISQLHLLFKN